MKRRFGPVLDEHGARFRLWAPAAERVALVYNGVRSPMHERDGWFEAEIAAAKAGDRYAFALPDLVVPDPASRFQPDGVHQASELVDLGAFGRSLGEWSGLPWEEIIVYELHVGTFTRTGTYRGAIERLDDLRALGVTALELMPLAQPAGDRNWGYDGVALFAPARAHGRPEDLCALIDAAHARGLAIFLDVVYNHFGPEGNYLHRLSPAFFTDRHHTPWGSAVNLDGPGSEPVRAYFIENALHWLFDYGFDGLRLDAVNELRDGSDRHLLLELADRVREETPPGRHVHLILENDDNEAALLSGPARYEAQWNDDAHHALHVALTGEHVRYYRDYADPIPALTRALSEGYAYQGETSTHRGGAARGTASSHLRPDSFIDFLQNHDQIGNRAFGERITMLAPWEHVRAAAAIVLLAPAIPMLFMGEEWAASTPFLFFCDFSGELARAVTEGRRRELNEQVPDPNAIATFEASTLRWEEREAPAHHDARVFYGSALAARREHVVPLLRERGTPRTETELLGDRAFRVAWTFASGRRLELCANLGDEMIAPAGVAAPEVIFAAGCRRKRRRDVAALERALAYRAHGAMRPSSTYRLQLHAGFTFRDATALVPYLARLGISHAYTSPILRARPGSTHGYDIIDHNAFNPELGNAEEFAIFVAELHKHGMGLIIDFVPNHMGIGTENRWWFDVLEWGEESTYAPYFDIDWHPIRQQMEGKVLVPFLGEHFGRAVADGTLRLAYERPGGFRFKYAEHRFPVTPPTYAEILGGARNPELAVLAGDFKRLGLGTNGSTRSSGRELVQRLAELAEEPAVQNDLQTIVGEINRDEARFEHLIDGQRYRMAFWRVASDEINYRRFFDINGLAALRMEDPSCLADTHRLIFELIERGDVSGLRIDHVDGLFDPIGYCDLLSSRAELFGQELYLVVEKILARHETLRERWRVDGTTGYEYAALLGNLLVDAEAEPRLDRIYRRFTREQRSFEQIAYECRKLIMRTALAGELNVLANHLDRIAQADPRSRDFTLFGLRTALEEVIASFPVYRTYLKAEEIAEDDRRDIDWAIGRARKRDETSEQSIYDFIYEVLTTVVSSNGAPSQRERVLFAMRFQQFTSPVAAKGVEDTAFYRYHRFDALNEVGSDPGHFGVSIAAFHRENADRSRRRPESMLATSTHDTKRGEDVRARLAVLSEMPGEWGHSVTRWAQLNTRRRTNLGAQVVPDRNDEYFLYQTLVGAWPVELLEGPLEGAALPQFLERIEQYVVKALREAKRHSSWANPNLDYEERTLAFIRRILDVSRPSPFLTDFRRFVQRIARFGTYNSLTQTVLRVAGPGVPDTYRGTELWDLTLVDPDNRRPVDFAARRALLDAIVGAYAADPAALVNELLDGWKDGRLKLFLIWRLLQWRRSMPEAFGRGAYAGLETRGAPGEHVCAYRLGEAVVAVSRLTKRLLGEHVGHPIGETWKDAVLLLPPEVRRYTNVLTSAVVRNSKELAVAELFRDLPVAVLVPTRAR